MGQRLSDAHWRCVIVICVCSSYAGQTLDNYQVITDFKNIEDQWFISTSLFHSIILQNHTIGDSSWTGDYTPAVCSNNSTDTRCHRYSCDQTLLQKKNRTTNTEADQHCRLAVLACIVFLHWETEKGKNKPDWQDVIRAVKGGYCKSTPTSRC